MSSSIKQLLRACKEGIDKRDYEAAVTQAEYALEEEKGNVIALLFHGYCSAKLQRFEESEGSYLKAGKVDPKNVQVFLGLSELYELQEQEFERTGRSREKIVLKLVDAYERVMELDKTFVLHIVCLF